MPKHRTLTYCVRSLVLICLLCCSTELLFAQAQVPGTNTNGTPARDSVASKSNNSKWKDEDARIYYKFLGSEKTYYIDSSIHTFHRLPYTEPWYRNLGNLGSPTQNAFFTPDNVGTGPSLGYHVFDVYRMNIDSLKYYNTTRPYTLFSYQLGSKQEQLAHIIHTQNIKPYWNFAVEYYRLTSPGYYKIQRTIHDNASLSTHYESRNQHYELYGAIVYNKEQQDENGGILADSMLNMSIYNDRKTVGVALQNDGYSSLRSPVSNMLRDFSFLIQHSYTFGHVDTTYNEDSTSYAIHLTPRFRITHKALIGSEKHEFKDVTPTNDTAFYSAFFSNNYQSTDSIFSQQKWFYVDNSISLNGFIGEKGKQLLFNAGIGNRVDQFTTAYVTGNNNNNFVSNYVLGELKKEALKSGEWFYGANTQFFLTGDVAGNFLLNAYFGKDLGKNWGNLMTGFKQQLNNAPYSYTIYQNQYYQQLSPLNKESITQLYATLQSQKLGASGGIRNYVITNYIYYNELQKPAQDASAFSLTQIWLQKKFKLGILVLDNELALQQVAGTAPVNVPKLMGRHQLGIETYIFRHALKIASGVELRYNTPYFADSYSPIFNHFYYQNSYKLSNYPESSIFLNFKIKRFLAYFMVDQINQLYGPNTIRAQGYPAPDFNIRFGFNWAMVN